MLVLPQIRKKKAAGSFIDPASLTDSIWLDSSDTDYIFSDAIQTPIANDEQIVEWDHKGSYSTARTFDSRVAGEGPQWFSANGGYAEFLRGSSEHIKLDTTLFDNAFSSYNDLMFFFTANPSTTSSLQWLAAEGDSSGTTNVFSVLCKTNVNQQRPRTLLRNTTNTISNYPDLHGADYFDATHKVFGVHYDNVAEEVTFYDGDTPDTPVAYDTALSSIPTDNFAIGCWYRNGAVNLEISITQFRQFVAVPNLLTSTEITDLVTFLDGKIP